MGAPSGRKLSIIWWRMADNIDSDYFEVYLVTSQAGGLEPSVGRPYGVGKSTFALWFAYRAWAYDRGTLWIDWENQVVVDETPENERRKIFEEIIENWLFYSLPDLLDAVSRARKRIPAVVWDDAQLDCPSGHNITAEKRELIARITTLRPMLANLVLTAPSISDLAKPLRRLINWEVIVPRRGVYEVQFIMKRRDYYDPYQDRERLWYDASGTFDPLPEDVQKLYQRKREEVVRKLSTKREEKEAPEVDIDKLILGLHKEGVSIRKIARGVNMPPTTVYRRLKKLNALPRDVPH